MSNIRTTVACVTTVTLLSPVPTIQERPNDKVSDCHQKNYEQDYLDLHKCEGV